MKHISPFRTFFVLLLSFCFAATALTGQITINLGGLSPQLQCNQTWTNQNLLLRFTSTIASEDGTAGYCSFGVQPGFIWLYPCRLALDLSQLPRPITRIEADTRDNCGVSCTKLFAYAGGSQIAATGNTAVQFQTLALDFGPLSPDSCVVRSFEGQVFTIRIFTLDSPALAIERVAGNIVVSWPTNAPGYSLEQSGSLSSLAAWAPQTNNIQLVGSNFTYRATAALTPGFFRLRKD